MITRFSNQLSIPDYSVQVALEKLRCHALAKLKSKETFQKTGIATLNLHLSWISETNDKHKMDTPFEARLDENVSCVCER